MAVAGTITVPGPGELLVSEVFGPTFQGEGPSLGRRAGFVRLGRCNLDCGKGPDATWSCDTPYTWDWDSYDPSVELQPVSVAELVDRLSAMGVDLVVVTGGEPLLQQRRLLPFLRTAAERRWGVEVETNGTIAPLPELDAVVTRFNVSPKLPGSGIPPEHALRPGALDALRDSGRAIFKFVVADPSELEEVAEVAATYELAPIWIMPAGTTASAVLATARAVADPVLERGWHLTTRLQVLLWGNQRSR